MFFVLCPSSFVLKSQGLKTYAKKEIRNLNPKINGFFRIFGRREIMVNNTFCSSRLFTSSKLYEIKKRTLHIKRQGKKTKS
jgi:hypothetical protein